jgi:hypothetical protein
MKWTTTQMKAPGMRIRIRMKSRRMTRLLSEAKGTVGQMYV